MALSAGRPGAGSGRGAAGRRRRAPLVLLGIAVSAAGVRAFRAPFPAAGENPFLDLVEFNDPAIHAAIRTWYHAAPAAAVLLAGSLVLSVWRVWLEPRRGSRRRGALPPWPVSPADAEPSLVVGELHHPTALAESERPAWLTLPEKGLYTGILVVGAVGSGKTSACMYPFASQLLSWQAERPDRRAAGLVLEVKGDFCHGVRRILEGAGRGEDYVEIGLGGSWQWNPLDDPLLDTYSLAYSVSTLINQLFGKSREPFWQQAYTNLVRWIIELHRLLPGGWVTLRDVYRCTIDAELFARRIQEAKDLAAEACPGEAVIARAGPRGRRPGRSTSGTWGSGGGSGQAQLPPGPGPRGAAGGAQDPLREAGDRPGGRPRAPGAGGCDRTVVPERLDGARREAPDLDRRGDQRLPLALRPARGGGRLLSAASGAGRGDGRGHIYGRRPRRPRPGRGGRAHLRPARRPRAQCAGSPRSGS